MEEEKEKEENSNYNTPSLLFAFTEPWNLLIKFPIFNSQWRLHLHGSNGT